MDTPAVEEDLAILLRRHAELESEFGDGDGGRFLSGWQCENPWIGDIQNRVEQVRSRLDYDQYLYFDNDDITKRELLSFHETIDQVQPEDLLPGTGSSSIIFTFCAWLRQQGIRELFYIPPLYFTLHFALRLFEIRARPVSGRHAFEENFSLNLPTDQSILLLADPIWYAGVPLSNTLVELLVDWQRRTESLLFVDGSFQYASWNGHGGELTAFLDPARTIRLICPTKALACHAYRFAYALLPKTMHAACAHIYANIYGSASAENFAFARTAPSLMGDGTITRLLMQLAADRHRSLRQRRKLSAPWDPSCGYFVFERVCADVPNAEQLMDGSFFEQKRYCGYRRINLLSPSIHLLG